jgi:sugar phosphate isomerase/epimerase
VNIGRVRGSIPPDGSYQETARLFGETAERIIEEADRRRVTLILEPVNRYEINFINSLGDAAALVTGLPRSGMGLMPDVFHMNIEDASISGSLVEHGSLVKYIHFADSNRRAPGQGHLDFDDILGALSRIGFDGWASVEILPVPDADTAAKQAADFLLPKIRRYKPERPN